MADAEPNRYVDEALAERLYKRAKAKRWRLPRDAFASALEASCTKAFPEGDPGSHELSRYMDALHLEDLALACACALGEHAAWDHFVIAMRPSLYRAADALDPSAAPASWPTRSTPSCMGSITAAKHGIRC